MICSSGRCVLRTLALALPLQLASIANAFSPDTIYIKVSGDGKAADVARSVAREFGIVQGQNPSTKAFSVKIHPGLSSRRVIDALRNRREVSEVWSDQYRPTGWRFS
ncbi:MAG TPA: hypothetical protein VK934_08985, partial [Fimbriimonas sp.]|nr:hypothetical protein [Fimbriimonas sp.]